MLGTRYYEHFRIGKSLNVTKARQGRVMVEVASKVTMTVEFMFLGARKQARMDTTRYVKYRRLFRGFIVMYEKNYFI